MKIKCVYNTGKNISENLLSLYGYSENMIFEKITIGNIYTVYAIFTMKEKKWYLICSDWYDGAGLNFPEFFPASLFEIIDESPSRYWISTCQKDDYTNSGELVLNTGFPNMINEECFYGNLLEDNEREVNLFKKYKHLIDMEKEL
jgi:hypothetical protein